MWNLISVCWKTVLMSVQDSCMVYAGRTTGSEIVLDAPGRNATRRGSCGILFQSVCRHCERGCKIGAWFTANVPEAQKSF
jgi:hypothetical protein